MVMIHKCLSLKTESSVLSPIHPVTYRCDMGLREQSAQLSKTRVDARPAAALHQWLG